MNAQRGRSRRVSESTFYSLIQYFAIVLFECAEADDFSPAKSLMNMCFTFYLEGTKRKLLFLFCIVSKIIPCITSFVSAPAICPLCYLPCLNILFSSSQKQVSKTINKITPGSTFICAFFPLRRHIDTIILISIPWFHRYLSLLPIEATHSHQYHKLISILSSNNYLYLSSF